MTLAAASFEPEVVLPPGPGAAADLRPLAGGQVVRREGAAIGTSWRLSMVLDDLAKAAAGEAVMARALTKVIAQMSQWEPASEISRFNAAPAGSTHIISDGFAHVLDCALTIAEISDGAFDPALGQASEAWGFGAAPAPDAPPAAETLHRAHGVRNMLFDPAARRIVQPGGLRLDLSGIAKGFAVDLASHNLLRAGIRHHLVEIGGELRAHGVRPDGQPWWVEVEPAPHSADPPMRIALTGWSVATSGDWHRRRGEGAASWSHTLSPETGAPAQTDLRAATVLHRGCMQADALATVMMVLGGARGLALADRYGLAARLVRADGSHVASAAWRAML